MRTDPAHERGDQRHDGARAREDQEDKEGVDRERHGTRADSRIHGACPAPSAPVEPERGLPDARDHVLRQPGGLPRERAAHLRAGREPLQRLLRRAAGQHAIHELARLGAVERLTDQAVELAALRKAASDALEHAVTHKRIRQLLRKRPGEDAVDKARDLGRRGSVVRRRVEPTVPDARGEI